MFTNEWKLFPNSWKLNINFLRYNYDVFPTPLQMPQSLSDTFFFLLLKNPFPTTTIRFYLIHAMKNVYLLSNPLQYYHKTDCECEKSSWMFYVSFVPRFSSLIFKQNFHVFTFVLPPLATSFEENDPSAHFFHVHFHCFIHIFSSRFNPTKLIVILRFTFSTSSPFCSDFFPFLISWLYVKIWSTMLI